MMLMKTLVIAPCTKVKAKHQCSASEMYQSHLFKLVKQYVKIKKYDWVILSSRHGILEPNTVINPYNDSLLSSFKHRKSRKSTKFLRKFEMLQDKVNNQLKTLLIQYELVIVMVGSLYQQLIQPILEKYPLKYNFWFRGKKGYGGICKALRKELI